MDTLKSHRGEHFPAEVLTPEEITAILSELSRRGACGVRDRALILLLTRAGLRIECEAFALEPKDVDVARGTLDVLRGKGGKRRALGLEPETCTAIAKWLVRRDALGIPADAPLFCTLAGKRMQRVVFTQKLKELGRRAGIAKRVHPHGLRHAFATRLVDEGVDLRVIQEALGHKRLSTTETYIHLLRPRAVIDAMKGLAW